MDSVNRDLLTICLDFDGVLHQYREGWQGPIPTEPPVPGALQFVNDMLDRGHNVVVCSCRARGIEGKQGIMAWLDEHGFPEVGVFHGKPGADVYIDDRGLRFTGDWGTIRWIILGGSKPLAPWFKDGGERE